MVKISTSYIAPVVILTLLTGCNNDIFIEGPDLPQDTYAVVEGDGGEVSFTISTTGLESVSLDLMSDAEKYCVYYNYSGEIVDWNCPAYQLGKIVFDTGMRSLTVDKIGDRIFFTSSENAFGEYNMTLRLEYDYTVKFINVKILPGQPVELLRVDYSTDTDITDIAETRTHRTGFTNNSSLPQIIEERPFLQAYASVLIEPDQHESWTRGETFTIPVLIYENGQWIFKDTPIMPGTSYRYYRPDQMMVVHREIPAYSSVSIFTDITYTQAVTHGTMVFMAPVSERLQYVDFKSTSLYPTDYNIRIEDAL